MFRFSYFVNNINLVIESCFLITELTNILRTSNDPDELKYIWTQWRNKTKESKKQFKEYVDLVNEAARLNNYTDYSEQWIDEFETKDFREQIVNLWEQVKPLYLQIHAYIRQQLRLKHGDNVVSEKGPIPAHLLG